MMNAEMSSRALARTLARMAVVCRMDLTCLRADDGLEGYSAAGAHEPAQETKVIAPARRTLRHNAHKPRARALRRGV